MMDLRAEREKAQKFKKSQHKLLDRLKKNPPRDLDQVVMAADEAVFAKLDCLACANCCKTISPIFTSKDVERIASRLGMAPGKFMDQYLRIDEDHDMVLKSSPCPFLQPDNRCRIYDDRPKACREYPHTGQRKFQSHIEITKQNILVCPAAFRVVELLEQRYGQETGKRD
jgi:Fe-S-cluster containining protein